MLQTTLRFHGQLNWSRKQPVASGGLKEPMHMDSISCVAWMCLSIKEEGAWDLECLNSAVPRIIAGVSCCQDPQ